MVGAFNDAWNSYTADAFKGLNLELNYLAPTKT
jgi:hypothetical protein